MCFLLGDGVANTRYTKYRYVCCNYVIMFQLADSVCCLCGLIHHQQKGTWRGATGSIWGLKYTEVWTLKLIFDARRDPGEDTGAPLGPDPKKTQKDHFLGPSFWTTFVTYVGTFVLTVLCLLSKPRSCYLFRPKGIHRPQFRSLLGVILVAFRATLEKWKLRSRVHESIKIKLQRVHYSAWFVIFM